MNGPQLVAVWALLALAVVGVPAAAGAWWAGRRSLRAALDPGRLAPVADPEVRVAVDADTLPIAGYFPVEPGLRWSEVEATSAFTDYAVKAAADRTEREIADMIAVANRRIPWL